MRLFVRFNFGVKASRFLYIIDLGVLCQQIFESIGARDGLACT